MSDPRTPCEVMFRPGYLWFATTRSFIYTHGDSIMSLYIYGSHSVCLLGYQSINPHSNPVELAGGSLCEYRWHSTDVCRVRSCSLDPKTWPDEAKTYKTLIHWSQPPTQGCAKSAPPPPISTFLLASIGNILVETGWPLKIKHIFCVAILPKKICRPNPQKCFLLNSAVSVAISSAIDQQLRCTDFYEFFECLTFMSFLPPSHDCLKAVKMASVADTALNHHSLTHSLTQLSIWSLMYSGREAYIFLS